MRPSTAFWKDSSFDRDGRLWCVDILRRVFRIDRNLEWELIVQYDGWPNGLKIHKNGEIYITDYKKGLLKLDPKSGKIEPFLETAFSESFKGLNDLHFADNGDLYFTDQGQTGIGDPTGRVWRLRTTGELQRIVQNAPSPNGITLNTKNTQIYVADARSRSGGFPHGRRHAVQDRCGDPALRRARRPDGIEMDSEDGLLCAISAWGLALRSELPAHASVHAGADHRLMTNIAFRGKTLYITDSLNGEILTAEMPVAGKDLFSMRYAFPIALSRSPFRERARAHPQQAGARAWSVTRPQTARRISSAA